MLQKTEKLGYIGILPKPKPKKQGNTLGTAILFIVLIATYHFVVVAPNLNPSNVNKKIAAQIMAEEEIPMLPALEPVGDF